MRSVTDETNLDEKAIEALLSMNQAQVSVSAEPINVPAGDCFPIESVDVISAAHLISPTETDNSVLLNDPNNVEFSFSTSVISNEQPMPITNSQRPKKAASKKKLTKKEQLEFKRAKNREAARSSRQRRMNHILTLQQQILHLKSVLVEKNEIIASLMENEP